MYLNIERQGSFRMFPSGARFNVLGFSSENGLNNAAMMGYAFDPNKNYVFVIGKLSGGELCCVITENLAGIYVIENSLTAVMWYYLCCFRILALVVVDIYCN
ncbi:hypothetical protein V6Z12_A11G336100 [Gossypium hirsutum]